MKLLFYTIFLLCPVISFAQQKPVTLNGTLSMNTGEAFPYKIVFTETDGVVKGYTITYAPPDDTKTLIQGMLDRRSHMLTFKETEIVYSHNVRTRAYMCLVDAKLVYNISKENALKGAITSKQTDNTSCTGGTLTFSNSDEIQFLFAYHDKYDTAITMRRKVKEPQAEIKQPAVVAETPLITDKVTAGIEKTYDWYTDTVVIDLWDGGNTDGDRVTIQLNGKPYLTNYYLVKERKQLRLPLLSQGMNTVSIVADNEGSDPPNTASLLFTDGTTKYSVLAYNNKGGQAIIKIKKVKR